MDEVTSAWRCGQSDQPEVSDHKPVLPKEEKLPALDRAAKGLSCLASKAASSLKAKGIHRSA